MYENENTARRIEIEVVARPKIVHYRRITYVKWDNVVIAAFILIALLIMVLGHVESKNEAQEQQAQMAAFYAKLESDARFHEYQQEQIRESEALKEAKKEAEEKENELKAREEKLQAEEEALRSKKETGTDYVPRM